MTIPDDEAAGLRPTAQEDLELNPQAHDSSANRDVRRMNLDPASLFEQALEQTRMAISITDPHQPDNPIVYINQAFVELTGYEREEIVGRNCRFLQGADTAPEALDSIREAMERQEVRVIDMVNYRKDGSAFWNALHIGPVFDDDGNLTHFYGSQWDITETVAKSATIAFQEKVADEMHHRTGNLFNVIASILRLSARGEEDTRALVAKVEGRILALGEAHRISLAQGRVPGEESDLHDLVSTVLKPYRSERNRRIVVGGDMVRVPRDAVTPLGLMLHELATNAVKYGAFSVPEGKVDVAWERDDDRLRIVWHEEGGPAVTAPETRGTGSTIMDGVLRMIGATLTYDWPPTGLTATLEMSLIEG